MLYLIFSYLKMLDFTCNLLLYPKSLFFTLLSIAQITGYEKITIFIFLLQLVCF